MYGLAEVKGIDSLGNAQQRQNSALQQRQLLYEHAHDLLLRSFQQRNSLAFPKL